MTLADLLDAVLKLMGPVDTLDGCLTQAVFIEFEYMLSITTSFTMGFLALYLTFLNGSLNIVLLNHLKLVGWIVGVSIIFGLSILFIPEMVTNSEERLLFFLGSFVIVWFFVALDQLVIFASGSVFGIGFLKALFSPLRGLWNFLAYYLSNYFYKQEKNLAVKALGNSKSKSIDFIASASSVVKTATPKIAVLESTLTDRAKESLVAVNKNYVKPDYSKLHILK
ncbi:hypothetical protein HDV01_006267 [Terramyces sp. JEL0728]|nr:hypothetical protein HDV01_006267 [Terramyces sp. JEL0728]